MSWNERNLAEHDQKLIKSVEYHDECIHQVWIKSTEWCVRKCAETTKTGLLVGDLNAFENLVCQVIHNRLYTQSKRWLDKLCHDDVIKWKHFPRYWPFVREIHRSPVNFPHKGQWRGALMFSLICVWINGWVNNRAAGDLRRYRAHYDVIVMAISDHHLWEGMIWTTGAKQPKFMEPHQFRLSMTDVLYYVWDIHWYVLLLCCRECKISVMSSLLKLTHTIERTTEL